MGYLLLLALSIYITGSLCDLLLHNSSYIYTTYCADTNNKNYTSWMWNKAACESEWDGKNDTYIGKLNNTPSYLRITNFLFTKVTCHLNY